ncbi:MAG: gliding motility-associated ABC transporter ATP-binding subunit GldA [Candidatus Amoebophilus sp. 36-38]|nr:MAG: gliding motility-associated ABC transporter ATP-binding subunit GldA [Candidatus Amoebophilus sp. 36-38]
MSIVVHKLSKHFQHKIVVDQLDFQVEKGQIVGLLGPNGAGKSTTMRMLTGYIPPSEGEIHICNHNLNKSPLKAKKNIGYLPEHNPLYTEMYVHEYLRFMGTIHGLGKSKSIKRAQEVVAQCGIGDMQNKKLGALSRGYRQRVGLAQALIHDPAVLILDEPTAGLDPNQLNYIRGVIKELGREKAILFSTHIMQEVEAICDRVLILHQGTLRLSATLDELAQYGSDQFIVSFKEPIPVEQLQTLSGIKKIELLDAHTCKLYVNHSKDIYEPIFHFAKLHGLTLQRMEQKKETLEDIFTQLTNTTHVQPN